MQIKVYRELPEAKLPTIATNKAQCIDLYAAEDVEIGHCETKVVTLGIRVVLPEGYGLEFRERSGLAVKGILIGAGVIDEDYHGTLKAVVRYLRPNEVTSPHSFRISIGDKIVQAELVKRISVEIQDVGPLTFQNEAELAASHRGDKGFGSTGT